LPWPLLTIDSLIYIGDILGPHGIKGVLSIYSFTRPLTGIARYQHWKIGKTKHLNQSYPVRRCWQHGKNILAELEGIGSSEEAMALKGARIWVTRGDISLSAGEYLWAELQGCRVCSDEDEMLGIVSSLQEYGAQDILCIATEEGAPRQGEWMLPFIEEVVLGIDLQARRIDVHLPDGIDACFTPRS